MAKEYHMERKVYCNRCGREFDVWDVQHDFSIQRRIGFGSKYDGDFLNLDLCCDCMDKLIDECEIPPVEPIEFSCSDE